MGLRVWAIGVLLTSGRLSAGELNNLSSIESILDQYIQPEYRETLRPALKLASDLLESNFNIEHARKDLEASLHVGSSIKNFDGGLNNSWIIDLSNGLSLYLNKSCSKNPLVEAEDASIAFVVSKNGDLNFGSFAFNLSCEGSFKGAEFEVYQNGNRLKSIELDSEGAPSRIDFYAAPSVLPLEQIYGSKGWAPLSDDAVKVAVIDSGVDYNHPEIARAIRRVKYADGTLGVEGFNFEDPNTPPFDCVQGDTGNHGTAVAGIVIENDSDIQIVPIRHSSDGNLYPSIDFAHRSGARVINLSLNLTPTDDPHQLERNEAMLTKAIREFSDTVFVVAAGNDGENVDELHRAPQSFQFSNMVVVGSVSARGELTNVGGFKSNFGENHVHFGALGENRKVAQPGGIYKLESGTSFSTPQVSRLFAQLKRKFPDSTPTELLEKVVAGLRPLPKLKGYFQFPGIPSALASEMYDDIQTFLAVLP